MKNILYKYILIYKKVNLPGIGTFTLHRKASQFNFTDKTFTAPSWFITFNEKDDSPSREFYLNLMNLTGETEQQLHQKVNDFSKDLKREISVYKKVSLNGLGTLIQDNNGMYRFENELRNVQSYFPDIIAEMVSRQNGEKSLFEQGAAINNIESETLLTNSTAETSGKTEWWVDAIILGILAIAAIAFYYYQNGSFH